MNFRRRQSKEMRSNSAKWHKTSQDGPGVQSNEKSNYEVTSATITHHHMHQYNNHNMHKSPVASKL